MIPDNFKLGTPHGTKTPVFFYKLYKRVGGVSNPFIKILAKVWYVMKKAKKGEKKGGKKRKIVEFLH